MDQGQAEGLLVRWLRDPAKNPSGNSTYGYDLWVPLVMREHLRSSGVDAHMIESRFPDLSPHFYAAGWDLCRRGILRPGISRYGGQATADGGSGNGYSITPFGQKWLAESDRDDYVPTESNRFAKMLEPHRDKLGPVFYQRAQEAVLCYGAHTYLACCVMCGAAAESILLSVSIAKYGEQQVLKAYSGPSGRSRVENLLLGKARGQLRREFLGFLTLIKYWRDQAGHGKPVRISDNEALTSLALLLRFAAFVSDSWDELTGDGENG